MGPIGIFVFVIGSHIGIDIELRDPYWNLNLYLLPGVGEMGPGLRPRPWPPGRWVAVWTGPDFANHFNALARNHAPCILASRISVAGLAMGHGIAYNCYRTTCAG
jgi:hypothetical protein